MARKLLQIRLRPELAGRAEAMAQSRGRPLGEIVRQFLEEQVREWERASGGERFRRLVDNLEDVFQRLKEGCNQWQDGGEIWQTQYAALEEQFRLACQTRDLEGLEAMWRAQPWQPRA